MRYCLNDGLYVVLNDHWDGGWIEVEGFSSSTKTFVNTVRATGGRNAQRTLIIQTPSTSIASATDPAVAFSVPSTPSPSRASLQAQSPANGPIKKSL